MKSKGPKGIGNNRPKARHVNVILLVLGLVALCPSPMAGQAATSVLVACEQAMGGQKAERPFYAEADVFFPGESSPSQHIIWKTKGHDLFRQEIVGSGDTSITIVNRGQGSRRTNNKNERLRGHATAYFRQEYVPALACTVDRDRAGMLSEYMGQETIAGEPAHHIRFSMAPKGKDKNVDDLHKLISEYHVFISVASNRVLATRTWIFSPEAFQNRSVWETFYSDYRPVDGVLMPFHLENRVAGQKARELVLTTVRVDSSIADSDFE